MDLIYAGDLQASSSSLVVFFDQSVMCGLRYRSDSFISTLESVVDDELMHSILPATKSRLSNFSRSSVELCDL